MKYNKSLIMKNAWSMMTSDTLFSECLKEAWKIEKGTSIKEIKKIYLNKNEIENIAKTRGYKLPHVTVNTILKTHEYVDFLNYQEMDKLPTTFGYDTLVWLKLSQEEKSIIRNNKAIELLVA